MLTVVEGMGLGGEGTEDRSERVNVEEGGQVEPQGKIEACKKIGRIDWVVVVYRIGSPTVGPTWPGCLLRPVGPVGFTSCLGSAAKVACEKTRHECVTPLFIRTIMEALSTIIVSPI